MKKVFLFISLFIALLSFGQTIDTTVTNCTAAKINSVVISHGFPTVSDTITHVGFFDYTDDLKGNCVVNWVVISKGVNINWNKYKLSDNQYTNWDGTATGLLSILGNYLHLTFK